ncbi:hypothetical protein M3Y99_00109600 [Aphelenchoides fujianensis]|nr:hypothetical protein M3Y99_00109600 [Aphelenchoides fujianensis]
MITWEERKEASYQIMILLGCIHCIGLQTSGLFAGIWTFQGAVFCTHPTVAYVTGCIAVSSWCASTLTSQILGINRCFVLFNRSVADYAFSGWRKVAWMSLPVVFLVWMCGWTVPPVFSALAMSYVYDPHLGYFNDFGATYKNIPHTVNNLFVCATESLIYCGLIVLYLRATRSASSEERHAASRDKRFYVQVVLVGGIHFIAGLTYVIIQFFPVTQHPSVIIMASTFYLLSQGAPPVIYIAVNRSLRNQIRKAWGIGKTGLFGDSAVAHSTGAQHSQQNGAASISNARTIDSSCPPSFAPIERPQTAAANVHPAIITPPISNVPRLPPITPRY